MDAMRVLSLGIGVQSSTVAHMVEEGKIAPIDAAIFSDTEGEPQAVYDYRKYLLSTIKSFPIYTVSAGNLWESATTVKTTRDGLRSYIKTALPVYMVDGLRRGMGQRHCTRDFKIAPVTRKCRELLGLRRVKQDAGILVEMLMGISTDEASRMKPNPNPWIRNVFPLIDANMSRADCLAWCEAHGKQRPPRSACTFCSFHSDAEWLNLTPGEFADAVTKERQLQAAYDATSEIEGIPFLHAARIPLGDVTLGPQPNPQLNLFQNECEGMCGV